MISDVNAKNYNQLHQKQQDLDNLLSNFYQTAGTTSANNNNYMTRDNMEEPQQQSHQGKAQMFNTEQNPDQYEQKLRQQYLDLHNNQEELLNMQDNEQADGHSQGNNLQNMNVFYATAHDQQQQATQDVSDKQYQTEANRSKYQQQQSKPTSTRQISRKPIKSRNAAVTPPPVMKSSRVSTSRQSNNVSSTPLNKSQTKRKTTSTNRKNASKSPLATSQRKNCFVMDKSDSNYASLNHLSRQQYQTSQSSRQTTTPSNRMYDGGQNTQESTSGGGGGGSVIKSRLKQLFLNYCNFNVETGSIYVSFSSFLKLASDSKVIDSKVTQNNISIMLSKVLGIRNNMIKTIDFEQFLDCVLGLSQLKYPSEFNQSPKVALQIIINKHMLPLIESIEDKAVNSDGSVTKATQLYSLAEHSQRQMVYNSDTMAIFMEILPLIQKLYSYYFEQEFCSISKPQDIERLQKASLKSTMRFSRDFEICPLMVHQRACFLIWYQIYSVQSDRELTNFEPTEHNMPRVLPKGCNIGKAFTLHHFIIFIFRISVVYFNNCSQFIESSDLKNFNLIKKLLFFFRKLESSDALSKFVQKIGRTYTKQLSFLPSKDLLAQIIVCEGLQKYISGRSIQMIPKENMVNQILSGQTIDEIDPLPSGSPRKLQLPEQEMMLLTQPAAFKQDQSYDEGENLLKYTQEKVKQIFESYCSYGEPMNTRTLKSQKLLKMFKDTGILKDSQKNLPRRLQHKAQEIKRLNKIEVDLALKLICSQKVDAPSLQNTGSFVNLNSSRISTSRPSSRNNSRSRATIQQSDVSGRVSGTTSMRQSFISQSNYETNRRSGSRTPENLKQDRSLTRQAKDRLTFGQFNQLLVLIAPQVYPSVSKDQTLNLLLDDFILPLLNQTTENVNKHSDKMNKLLNFINSESLIKFMGDLYSVLFDAYMLYAEPSNHLMNFNQFIMFCKDHDIFPDVISKAALYRIFHSLSFLNESLNNQSSIGNKNVSKILAFSQQTNIMSSINGVSEGQKVEELIDENMFVEALTISSIYEMSEQLPSEITLDEPDAEITKRCISKALQLVERMANSDGVYKKNTSKQNAGSEIKCNMVQRKDLIAPFRTKYKWYFKQKYCAPESARKTRFNYDQVMQMQSVDK